MSLTVLSPVAGAVAAGALLPLAAAVAGERRVAAVRRALRLPPGSPDRWTPALAGAAVCLLALAATQPALARSGGGRVRTDAAALVVLDVSRSMQASAGPDAPTRLAQARAAALRIRAALPEVPTGVAVMTDRVVPLLFPTADQSVFQATVQDAVRSETPPPLQLAPTATTFDALGALGTQGFFSPTARHRVVVLLTDGESEPFDAPTVAADLGSTRLVVVRIWHAGDRVYDGTRPEPAYRPDPASAALVRELADANGGRVASASTAASDVRHALGPGPTAPAPGDRRRTPLAPWLALAALVPLAALFRRTLLAAL